MPSSLLDQCRYTISDIRLLDPPVTLPMFHKPTFLIEIYKVTDSGNELLKLAEGIFGKNEIVWSKQILNNNVTAECTINFKVLRKRKKGGLETIGEYRNIVSGLLDIQKTSKICKTHLSKKSRLSFTIKEDRFKDMLARAEQQSEGIYFKEGEFWSTFLTYFEIVKTAVDSILWSNSYAQQTWSILSIVPDSVHTHMTRNNNFRKLLERLMDIYKYINEVDRLHALTDTQSDNLKLLIDKTCDCADFIKKYTENNAAINFMKGPILDDKIFMYKESFDQLFKTIQESLVIGIKYAASNIEDFNLLREMPYAENAGFINGKKCLPGTREKLINEILEWVDNKDAPGRVFVLSGQAGMGKSAVAHTITETFRTQNRLCSLFCFSRSDKDRRNLLFSTISRDLADGNVSWRQNLVHAIEVTAIRKSLDPVTQFNEMIIKPSRSVGMTGPVIIVIDALDESGDRMERQSLLDFLLERSSELPSNFRLIITCRPEPDIQQQCQRQNVFCKYMADVDPSCTLNDIRQFISHKLSPVEMILDEELEIIWRSELAKKAQGLFQWANLACLYINPMVSFGLAERLRIVISRPTSSIYELYHEILDDQPEFQVDGYFSVFQMIIGAIVVARKPLSVIALQNLFGHVTKDVNSVLRPLHSLFIGVNDSTMQIRPLHASLLDFFVSPEQKPGIQNRYYIDTSDQSSFTHACLRVMNRMLRFNICGLETSHLRNRDVPNFNSRVAEAIPLHLSYACCFWGYHLEYSRLNPDLLEEIRDLMHNKLLYLFEALGLLGEIQHGHAAMQILNNKTRNENSELAAQATEASQFVLEFGVAIMESTPHLYLSSLPYISNHSFISQKFILRYPQLLSIDAGQTSDLQPEIKGSIVQRHPSAHLKAVAFSPQGRRIAAGFDNGDFWVWDHITGEVLRRMGPKRRATVVCNVTFSLDGELVYCCFKDGSILTWEAKTDQVVYNFNEGLIEGECHECTISSDGRYVAFQLHADGDLRNRVRFYERQTHSKLFGENSKFYSKMLFSPSGRLFGFQSQDRALRLWDTHTQTFVSHCVSITEPWTLEALTDNYMIARMDPRSNFPRARVLWDIITSTKVRQFEPESNFRGNSTFSANGKYLLCSQGNKHRIWDTTAGEITQCSAGRDGRDVFVTAVSPDSKYIALAMSNSTTIHVLEWNFLAQEETKDSSERTRGGKLRYTHCSQVWLKGQHLLLKIEDWSFPRRGYLHVFDTTGKSDVDFRVDFSDWLLVEVSPENDHWSIAYVDGSQANMLRLWNIYGENQTILDKSEGRITTFTFSVTGDYLVSGDIKGNIKILDVRIRQLISCAKCPGRITALAFSLTGATFLVAYDTDENAFVEERDCSAAQSTVGGPIIHDSTISSIFVACNKTHICVYSITEGLTTFGILGRPIPYRLKISDSSTGGSIECFNTYLFPRLSPNRRYIAWIPNKDLKKVEVWDLEKRIALDGFLFNNEVKGFSFSSDSRRISILGNGCAETDCIDIWDIETRRLVMRRFFNDSSFKGIWRSSMVLYKDTMLLVDTRGMGRIWNLDVHEIMTLLYDDHLNNSQFGMLPMHLAYKTRRLIEDHKLSPGNIKALEYALVAWNKASFSPFSKLDKNGWMLGPHGELLFWVPQEMRRSLWYPSVTYMVSEVFTKLNFDRFTHGTRWTECRMQPKPDIY